MAESTRSDGPEARARDRSVPGEVASGPDELQRLDAALQQVIRDRGGEIGLLGHYEEGLQEISKLIHRVNNPLTSLLGRAQILRLGQDLDPRVAKATDVIEQSAQRIADDVKAISRVVQVLREAMRNRRSTIGAD